MSRRDCAAELAGAEDPESRTGVPDVGDPEKDSPASRTGSSVASVVDGEVAAAAEDPGAPVGSS